MIGQPVFNRIRFKMNSAGINPMKSYGWINPFQNNFDLLLDGFKHGSKKLKLISVLNLKLQGILVIVENDK